MNRLTQHAKKFCVNLASSLLITKKTLNEPNFKKCENFANKVFTNTIKFGGKLIVKNLYDNFSNNSFCAETQDCESTVSTCLDQASIKLYDALKPNANDNNNDMVNKKENKNSNNSLAFKNLCTTFNLYMNFYNEEISKFAFNKFSEIFKNN